MTTSSTYNYTQLTETSSFDVSEQWMRKYLSVHNLLTRCIYFSDKQKSVLYILLIINFFASIKIGKH